MSIANSSLANGPSTGETTTTNQSLREELYLAKKQIAALRQQSDYYRKMALAMSRKAVTADILLEWLKDDPGTKTFTFSEVLAKLKQI